MVNEPHINGLNLHNIVHPIVLQKCAIISITISNSLLKDWNATRGGGGAEFQLRKHYNTSQCTNGHFFRGQVESAETETEVRQGRPWPPHFLSRTWATPYDHALID